jgi:hypothetical protein
VREWYRVHYEHYRVDWHGQSEELQQRAQTLADHKQCDVWVTVLNSNSRSLLFRPTPPNGAQLELEF